MGEGKEEEEEEEEDTQWGGSGGSERHSCRGGGGSYNFGKSKKNECCFNEAGHGQVTIILL